MVLSKPRFVAKKKPCTRTAIAQGEIRLRMLVNNVHAVVIIILRVRGEDSAQTTRVRMIGKTGHAPPRDSNDKTNIFAKSWLSIKGVLH